MTNQSLQSVYGLKFNPFRPDIPQEALLATPAVDAFCRRVEFALADGGFALITGHPALQRSRVVQAHPLARAARGH